MHDVTVTLTSSILLHQSDGGRDIRASSEIPATIPSYTELCMTLRVEHKKQEVECGWVSNDASLLLRLGRASHSPCHGRTLEVQLPERRAS